MVCWLMCQPYATIKFRTKRGQKEQCPIKDLRGYCNRGVCGDCPWFMIVLMIARSRGIRVRKRVEEKGKEDQNEGVNAQRHDAVQME